MNRRSAYIAILSMVLFFLFGSCGEEGVGPECVNCEYWHRISSGSARFPDVNPANWRLIAFSSKRGSLGGASKNYHIWVMELGESPSDTARFYQITKDDRNDLRPSWSSDGKWIAFQREVCPSGYEIYAVDVSDLDNPGKLVRVTRIDCPKGNLCSNTDPCWVTIGDTAYVVFTNSSVANTDHDILIARFDTLGPQTPIPLTIDPSDYAAKEGDVLSAVFHDWQTSSNRSNLVVFSSDSRTLVGDIRVEAYLADDTPVDAKILIKGKDSKKTTPYVFRYRPVDQPIELTCELGEGYHRDGYCDPFDTTVTSLLADALNTISVRLFPTKGTLKVAQEVSELRYDVFVDGRMKIRQLEKGIDKAQSVTCLAPGTHIVELWFITWTAESTLVDVDSNVVIQAGQVT
ncbi:MAG: TolB family protein [bacterium]